MPSLRVLSLLSLFSVSSSYGSRFAPRCSSSPSPSSTHLAPSSSRRAAIGRFIWTGIALHPASSFAADDEAQLVKARSQLAASEEVIADLLTRFTEICASEGGDGVRRVLGTVGTKSPLYKIEKAARLVALESSKDPDAALEEVDTLIGLIFNAEGDAYSSLWVPTGGGTNKEYWLAKSRKEVERVQKSLKRLIELQ